jgi:hypothetical protein
MLFARLPACLCHQSTLLLLLLLLLLLVTSLPVHSP